MARAAFAGVGKRYGDVVALADFTLALADGELVAVLGPSGCGKSTLLRLAAGLEPLSAGAIHLDGRRVDDLPPQARDVAMVFQSYALYPHMTVRGNVEFPLRMRGVGRAARRREAEEVAALLGLSELLDRRPAELSGGQRQRVALARALVRRPKLFLLDEPLSNLDARLRASVRRYIREVQRRLGVTTLYVTHDQTEAMTLGDRVVVLERGRVQQVDTPLGVYERPANAFVAGFVGTPPMNLLEAAHEGGVLRVGAQRLAVPAALRPRLGAGPGRVLLGVRPEAFAPAAEGLVAELEPGRVGAAAVTVRLPGVPPVLPARVAAAADALHVFTADGAARLGP
jgi:multiple sugar transport system ATP-binding protein